MHIEKLRFQTNVSHSCPVSSPDVLQKWLHESFYTLESFRSENENEDEYEFCLVFCFNPCLRAHLRWNLRLKTTSFAVFTLPFFFFFSCFHVFASTAIMLSVNHWPNSRRKRQWVFMSWKYKSHLSKSRSHDCGLIFLKISLSTSGRNAFPACVTHHRQLRKRTLTKQTNSFSSSFVLCLMIN